ncbi:Interferon alpha/beta receptor 2 [Sciurus carolinensis]|uniref:Interferon alpha/beta receptor 2 n=2 Tax=Sciurus carolinensis TaxID=30640 RepID=A0AA41TA44_SCICA|nr:Interferon alpha/beta receptor 2 [Sciurus carolinensis]
MKIIESCTNITTPFCDVTDVWEEAFDTYIVRVERFRGKATLINCTSTIWSTNILYEPPEFEVVGFTNHINVIVKFPPTAPKIYGEEIQRHLSLVIKEQSGEIVKMHKPKIDGNITGNFNYVIDNLIPNTNYCVSVYFEPTGLGTRIQPPSKCTFLRLDQESESSESAKISGISTVFLVALVFVSTILLLKRIGYICLRDNFPKVLNFHNFGAQSFPGLPPSEAVNAVEVISVTKKKKVWDYNYDDESDSDEEVALRSSAGGYTMHGLTGRLLSQVSSVTSQEPEMEDSEAEESDPSEPEPEPQPRLPVVPKPNPCQLGHTSGPYERRESLGCDSSPEDNHSSPGGSGDRITFNVNLNSVFMRVPDDDDSEEAALVSSLPEEIIDLEEDPHKMESSLLVASGERTQLTHPGPFSQCLWTEEDTLSDRSDTSDFDVDSGRDGYIMR